MGQIVGKLNLNKTPQLVDNYSLIFAKNIKLLKDGTISRDNGVRKLKFTQEDIVSRIEILQKEAQVKADYYNDLLSNSDLSEVDDNIINNLINYISGHKFIEDNESPFDNTYITEFKQGDGSKEHPYISSIRGLREAVINDYKENPRFPLILPYSTTDNKNFWYALARFDDLDFDAKAYRTFDYASYVANALSLQASNLDVFDSLFIVYETSTPYDSNNIYPREYAYLLNKFLVKHGDAINDILNNNAPTIHYNSTEANLYLEKHNEYYKKSEDYRILAERFDYADGLKILGHISYNTKFYIFVELISYPESSYAILCYDEYTDTFEPVNCNWNWSGGEITGYVVCNLNGDIILNIAEYKDEETLIPFKSINITKSSISDDESIYTQTPNIPIYNLNFKDYYSTPIPNGVYQFFIRYQISKDFYTPWYPASQEIFSGTRYNKETNQGGLSYIELEHDSKQSFIFEVEKLYNSEIKYINFQIGFIVSHDNEVYARSWKHFSMDTNEIYFDYDNNYIKEIDINDLTSFSFQLYNVKNITNFKDKLYISNYRESDFNPLLQKYADKVNITLNTTQLDFDKNINGIRKYNTTIVNGRITKIEDKSISSILKSLIEKGLNYYKEKLDKLDGFKLISQYGISLHIIKTKHIRDIVTHNIYPFDGDAPMHSIILDQGGESDHGDYSKMLKLHVEEDDKNKFIYLKHDEQNGYYKDYKQTISDSNVNLTANQRKVLKDDFYPGLNFTETINNIENYIIENDNAYINADNFNIEYDNPLIDFDGNYYNKFWYIKIFSSTKDYESDKSARLNAILNNNFNLSENRFKKLLYKTEIYGFTVFFTVNSQLLDLEGSTIIHNDVKTVNNVSQLTTLVPYQHYKFYLHYIRKNGEITNGYQIKNTYIAPAVAPGTLIYPEFSNIEYPDDYIACFITIQHYKQKTITVFNLEDIQLKGDAKTIGDCLELDTRLFSVTRNLTFYSAEGNKFDANYYPSFDPTYKQLFASSGKVVIEGDNIISQTSNYGYIVENYTNDSDDVLLTKCTPFITSDRYSTYQNMNLLGYIGYVKKVLSNLNTFYSDTDVFEKVLNGNDSFELTKLDNPVEWNRTVDSNYYVVFSNFNLNYLSLTLDVIPKLKLNEADDVDVKHGSIIAIDSTKISDIYELKSMYHDYTRRYYYKYNSYAKTKFDNTIRSSILEGDESVVNIYKFNSTDYYNVPINKGIIVNLVAVGESILVHTMDSIFKFSGTNSLMSGGGEEVQVKESQPFESGIAELFGSVYGYGGLQDKRCSLVSQAGYFFYDKDSNIIYGYTSQNKLGELSSPIEKLTNYSQIVNVDFACDFYNDRIFINIKFDTDDFVTLSYNFKFNSFVSLHDFDYDKTITTKTNCYFVKNDNIFVIDKNEITYKELDRDDKLFPYYISDRDENDNSIKACIVDVIYNEYYQQVKVLESINWICKAVTHYADSWYGEIRHAHSPARLRVFRPLMAEEYNAFYSGDRLRIYTDCCVTPLSNIKTRSNDFALYTNNNGQEIDESNRSSIDNQLQVSANSYKLPRFNLGSYSFNYFRNTYRCSENGIINQDYPLEEQGKRTELGDMQSLLYGRYFVSRFILDNRVNFKLENVIFITTPYK